MLSSVPVRAESYQISTSPTFDNTPVFDKILNDARAGSRQVTVPPAIFKFWGTLDVGGVDFMGTQAGTGTFLQMMAPNKPFLRYNARSPDGHISRGSIQDMTITAEVHTANNAIHAEGNAQFQPDHLLLRRLRITRGAVGSWYQCVAVNGMARTTVKGIRGLYCEELLLFESTHYHMSLFGVHDATLVGIRCYTPKGKKWGFYVGGSTTVPSIDVYGYGCDGPVTAPTSRSKNVKFV